MNHRVLESEQILVIIWYKSVCKKQTETKRENLNGKSVFFSVFVLSHSVVSHSFQPHGLKPTRLLCLWGFSRQEYWSELPCSPSGDLPNPGIEPSPQIIPYRTLILKLKNTVTLLSTINQFPILISVYPSEKDKHALNDL